MSRLTQNNRLLSLDVFRGFTIVAMILVNSPGNQTPYPFLNHAEWNGCNFADYIFPFFLFIVGVSLTFSLTTQLAKGRTAPEILPKILRRSLIIFAIGLFLNAFPLFDFSSLRVLGVLQRIAICYFIAALFFLYTSPKVQAIVSVALLIGYYLVMTCIPVPEFGAGDFSKAGNLAAFIDKTLLGLHSYRSGFDPEGILSTFPAIATVLLGNLTGIWLLSSKSLRQKMQGMLLFSVMAMFGGLIWAEWFPINKALWTSSFVLWTAGAALGCLAILYWLIEIKRWRRWSKPFEIFGLNALAAYVLHIYFLKVQGMIYMPRIDGSSGNLRFYLSEHLFGWASLANASLLYAITYVLFWLVIFWIFSAWGQKNKEIQQFS